MKTTQRILTSTLFSLAALAASALQSQNRTENIVLTALNDSDETLAERFERLDQEAVAEMADFDEANDALATDIINYASSLKGTPYRWGSTGPKSFDCSGFTGHVYKNFGIQLNRTSRQQFTQGEKVVKDKLQPGDLVFFAGRNGGKTVRHVGMVSDIKDNGKVEFIHSSTNKGVTHSFLEDSYYKKRYLGARRILTTD